MFNAEEFRFPEERIYEQKLKEHPALPKLRRKYGEFWQECDPELELACLRREGLRLTPTSFAGLFVAIDNVKTRFGITKQVEVFASRDNNEAGENAYVFEDGDTIVLNLLNGLLPKLTTEELTGIIGHEFGHYLLSHWDNQDKFSLLNLSERDSPVWIGRGPSQDVIDLLAFANLLSQVQELGADRFGLVACGSLDASVLGQAKLAAGFVGDSYSIADYLDQAEPVTDEIDLVMRTHPIGPNRCKALKLFSQSETYRKAVGEVGGTPLSDFQKELPSIVPLYGIVEYDSGSKTVLSEEALREHLLELSLVHIVASGDNKVTPAEVRVGTEFIPESCREAVLDRFLQGPEVTQDRAAAAKLYEEARGKPSDWKKTMVERFIRIARADRKVTEGELATVLALSERIGALEECAEVFRREFGHLV
jgi:hypothetical protein